jgi:hypothetical protein
MCMNEEWDGGDTHCIFALIRITDAVYVRVPKAYSELSSVNSACP